MNRTYPDGYGDVWRNAPETSVGCLRCDFAPPPSTLRSGSLPIIDVARLSNEILSIERALVEDDAWRDSVLEFDHRGGLEFSRRLVERTHVSLDRHCTSELDALRNACLSHGFLYATNHGVPQTLMDGVLRLAQRLHTNFTPEQLKRLERCGLCQYTPLGEDTTHLRSDHYAYADFYGSALTSPVWESMVRGIPGDLGESLRQDGDRWTDLLVPYRTKMEQLSSILVRGIALTLGVPTTHPNVGELGRYTSLRMNHYPPTPPLSTSSTMPIMGVGEHTDYGCVTILNQDDVGGLQVRYPCDDGDVDDGARRYFPAPPLHGAFVVNLGDATQVWSNDLYRSTPHRVVREDALRVHRYSVPFFVQPGRSTIPKPLKTCRCRHHQTKYSLSQPYEKFYSVIGEDEDGTPHNFGS